MPSSPSNLRGILAMVGAMAVFTVNDSMVKLATRSIPTGEIMAIRGVFACLLLLGLVVALGQARRLSGVLRGPVLLRGAMESLVSAASLIGLAHVPLGAATAIGQVTPLLLTALAAVLLKETVGWRRWSAVGVGFLGVLLITRPGPDGLNPFIFATLFCALLAAIRDLVTRRVHSSVPSMIAALGTTLLVCLFGFASAPLQAWQPVDLPLLGILALGGFTLAAGHWLIITAYRGSEVSAIGPFRYSATIFALVSGFFLFGEVPGAVAATGMALIVGSGLYAVHREVVRARAERVLRAPAPVTT